MPISHSKLGEIFGVEQSSPFAWQVDPGGEEGGQQIFNSKLIFADLLAAF